MHYYKRNLGDIAKKTAHLSPLEFGIYNLILDGYYAREQAPTLLEATRWARARTPEEKDAVTSVLCEFFTLGEDERYHQSRVDEEVGIYHGKAETNRLIAIDREAKKRALKEHGSCTGGAPENNDSSDSGEPNHKPLTINQEPEIKALVPGDAVDAIRRPTKPDCPHQEIIALYHEVLPQCPTIRDWTPARATQLRARWNEHPNRQNLDYWRDLFEYIGTCDFLVGRSAKPFFADLEWITKSSNFTKIREGKYENR